MHVACYSGGESCVCVCMCVYICVSVYGNGGSGDFERGRMCVDSCTSAYLGERNHRMKKMTLMTKNPQAVLLATSMGCKENRNSRASGGSKSFIKADIDSIYIVGDDQACDVRCLLALASRIASCNLCAWR